MELKKILSKLGIESLNEMQQQAIKTIQGSDDDVVILSPTGSGKTFAYLLPLIQKIDSAFDEVQAVVIVPGRELALQSQTVLKDMGSGLRSMALYGGRATMDEHRQMRDVQPQIVFATPGRLNDHLAKRNITATFIKYVVIDEFDKCLEMGFRDEMSSILQKLRRVRQHILLSATDAPEIPNFVRMSRTKRINFLKEDDQVPARVTIYQVHSPSKDKLETLSALLRTVGDESSVVFLNYRDSVERTASFLKDNGFTLSAFHYIAADPWPERNAVRVAFQIRHTDHFADATLTRLENGDLHLVSDTDVQGIAPGQFGVVYDITRNVCIGSGEIAL